MLHLKKLEKEGQMKLKVSRRRETIKIRAEINEIENKRTIEKINATKSWFFEKVNEIDKPLARLTKENREKTQTNKIRDERGNYDRHCRNTKDHTCLLYTSPSPRD